MGDRAEVCGWIHEVVAIGLDAGGDGGEHVFAGDGGAGATDRDGLCCVDGTGGGGDGGAGSADFERAGNGDAVCVHRADCCGGGGVEGGGEGVKFERDRLSTPFCNRDAWTKKSLFNLRHSYRVHKNNFFL